MKQENSQVYDFTFDFILTGVKYRDYTPVKDVYDELIGKQVRVFNVKLGDSAIIQSHDNYIKTSEIEGVTITLGDNNLTEELVMTTENYIYTMERFF